MRIGELAERTGVTTKTILDLKDAGHGTCDHTQNLLLRHLDDLDQQIARLQRARTELASLNERVQRLDPADCTDPARCQVITSHA